MSQFKSMSIYASHDASITINPSEGVYRIYEFERLLKERYCKINDHPRFEEACQFILEDIKKEYGIEGFDKCYFGKIGSSTSIQEKKILYKVFGINDFIDTGHHLSHAATALYQSNFDDCLIFSIDGGGWDENNEVSMFNIYLANRKNKTIEKIGQSGLDVGNAYSLISMPIKEIRKGNYLSYAGKIMGLAAYGKIRQEWIEPMRTFYLTQHFIGLEFSQLSRLGSIIKLDLSNYDTISGQDAYDLAATSQYIFEEVVFDVIRPYIEKYKLPICLTGGCALNVLFNDRLKKEMSFPVFVPPNPNDCGISLGQLLLNEPPEEVVDITYSGFDILDREKLIENIVQYNAKEVSISDVAKLIVEGKIIGVIRGKSECGPRALGNRSIICDPSFPEMKDILNHKVKFREWFRPFAPIVKEEEVNKYFDFEGEARFMSYSPKTKTEWLEKLKSIVHEDTTSRVQTVTREQNEFIYDLISEVDKIKNVGVILNTSFNIKGKPILTSIEDALEVLNTTELDYVLVENWLFEKK